MESVPRTHQLCAELTFLRNSSSAVRVRALRVNVSKTCKHILLPETASESRQLASSVQLTGLASECEPCKHSRHHQESGGRLSKTVKRQV